MDAGPGTGKTAVACARVAHLINEQRVPARGVWLISFTRTAVKEIRDRIQSYLKDPDALYGIKIATVDAHAWSIHQGFAPDAALTGSYDDNIARVIKLIDTSEEVLEYLEETQHLIVDEAQDLVGLRADLVLKLVARLRPEAGIIVFSDDAQAIYGFASDQEDDRTGPAVEPLTTRLVALGGFDRVSLHTVHRTSSPGLLEIFTEVRAVVIAPGEDPAARLAFVREAVAGYADKSTGKIFDPSKAAGEGVFVLFRRRSEVLQASSFLCQRQVVHRLRMSGMPPVLPAWVGATLGEFTQPVLTRSDFLARCGVPGGPTDPDAAWMNLESLAGTQRAGGVDMHRLRTLLGRAQPPIDIAMPDYGTGGPILGTIHAAKGRETDDVWMMLPTAPEKSSDTNFDEEARIVFVGATRARRTLTVGRGYQRLAARNLPGSGRVHELQSTKGMARVEIGRAGDLLAGGLVSRSALQSQRECQRLQSRMAGFDSIALPVRADCDQASGFVYRISSEGGQLWGTFSANLNGDLFKIGTLMQVRDGGGKRRPPDYLQHLYLTGIRTVVLRPDDPELETLHEPWRTSGIVLVPMIHGFTTTFFPYQRGRSYGR